MRHRGPRGEGRHDHHEGEERSPRKRLFESGQLKLVMLALLAEGSRHGYDLIRALEERSGGAYAPSPGIVYPTFTFLEEAGLITQQGAEGARKLYGLTAEGRAHLEAQRASVAEAFARLDHIRGKALVLSYGPVARALDNLKAALRGRLTPGVDKAVVFAVADALDEAARKIERL